MCADVSCTKQNLFEKGLLKQFTGIDDPYEKPENAEIVIDSSDENPEVLVDQILDQIHKMGYWLFFG